MPSVAVQAPVPYEPEVKPSSRRSSCQLAAVMVASCNSSVAKPSVVTKPPNAHSKSPIALLTIRVAFAGSLNTVAGTLLGACTVRRRDVSHPASSAPSVSAPTMRCCRCLIGVIGVVESVGEPERDDELRELWELGLVERVAAVRAGAVRRGEGFF